MNKMMISKRNPSSGFSAKRNTRMGRSTTRGDSASSNSKAAITQAIEKFKPALESLAKK